MNEHYKFKVGQPVRVEGLIHQTHLNGLEGRVIGTGPIRARSEYGEEVADYRVQFDDLQDSEIPYINRFFSEDNLSSPEGS